MNKGTYKKGKIEKGMKVWLLGCPACLDIKKGWNNFPHERHVSVPQTGQSIRKCLKDMSLFRRPDRVSGNVLESCDCGSCCFQPFRHLSTFAEWGSDTPFNLTMSVVSDMVQPASVLENTEEKQFIQEGIFGLLNAAL